MPAAAGPTIAEMFHDCKVRITGTDESPLFCANDLAAQIGDTNCARSFRKLTEGDVQWIMYQDARGCAQNTRFLTVGGMCKYLMQSKRPLANALRERLIAILAKARTAPAVIIVAVAASEDEVPMPALEIEEDLAIPPGA